MINIPEELIRDDIDSYVPTFKALCNPTTFGEPTFKVIIAGGRDYNDYEYLKKSCDKVLASKTNVEIVSGKAKGADTLGEKYAEEKGFYIKEFPANWDKYGKGAGPIRNGEMAKYADALIAFPGGSGTKNMIEQAKKNKLKIRTFNGIN